MAPPNKPTFRPEDFGVPPAPPAQGTGGQYAPARPSYPTVVPHQEEKYDAHEEQAPDYQRHTYNRNFKGSSQADREPPSAYVRSKTSKNGKEYLFVTFDGKQCPEMANKCLRIFFKDQPKGDVIGTGYLNTMEPRPQGQGRAGGYRRG